MTSHFNDLKNKYRANSKANFLQLNIPYFMGGIVAITTLQRKNEWVISEWTIAQILIFERLFQVSLHLAH